MLRTRLSFREVQEKEKIISGETSCVHLTERFLLRIAHWIEKKIALSPMEQWNNGIMER